ncbi:type IVB secretion system protein IcmH/DotU [Undibacterium sp. RuRC25W]|uniref:type IVB secretion system protein IcmH/DotU n=1 Tax=Undibacterium sp. RuRC25W TaxID=3413047 RepID=UPI003BF3339F
MDEQEQYSEQENGTKKRSSNFTNGEESGAPKEARFSVASGPNHEERLMAIIAIRDKGANPFLEAAHVLLRCLAEIPKELDAVEVHNFNQLLRLEIYEFVRLCDKANLRRDHMLAVRYCLCTALDEAVNQRSWGGGSKDATGAWTTMALLNHFHGESEGGNTVFLLIGRLANAAEEHIQVLEIIHHILCLGFKGEYRSKSNGGRDLETIRHRIFTLVGSCKQPVARELSPHWQGVGKGTFKILRAIPVWVSACILGLILFAMFSWFKYQLLVQQESVQLQIAALSKLRPPPKPTAPPLKLSHLLSEEISAGLVQVDEDDKHGVVVFKGDGMFVGLTIMSKTTLTLIDKVGQALSVINGKVRVVGHTDNQPIKTAEFANNQQLSLARAKKVAEQLQKSGVVPDRIDALGMGDTQPVNGDVNNRSANRRVELDVLYFTNPANHVQSSAASHAAPSVTHANQ